ncbi:helix-turn-helix domain-containing protein [Brachybacterium sp. ACRRE]|uniref:MarR family transcriptional regulator n=1 Tax=Brachybacterium sp. ACRRE TaxID=2918184 RepID=UPI001EF39DE2|nr:helix-turn-helix domain-containing protein [Brachybacterium sp. ACRRE]MCG7309031.1 MarR family transcriptional regulator [Brachybacterium sp. ACRRE]
MFVLTVDQHDSRRTTDRVPELIEALHDVPLRLRPERTAGDEVQMLADSADAVLACVLRMLELGGWSVGVGIGPVELPLPASVREGRGDAFIAARRAVESARRTSSIPVSVRTADPRQREQTEELQALLRLVGREVTSRKPGQWRVVHAMLEDPSATQAQIAERLEVTQQTVSRAFTTSGWREEQAVHPLVRRLLAMLDLTSDRSMDRPGSGRPGHLP